MKPGDPWSLPVCSPEEELPLQRRANKGGSSGEGNEKNNQIRERIQGEWSSTILHKVFHILLAAQVHQLNL